MFLLILRIMYKLVLLHAEKLTEELLLHGALEQFTSLIIIQDQFSRVVKFGLEVLLIFTYAGTVMITLFQT